MERISVHTVPIAGTIIVNHPAASERAYVQVISMSGSLVGQQQILSGAVETSVTLRTFTAGVYQLIWTDGAKRVTKQLFLN